MNKKLKQMIKHITGYYKHAADAYPITLVLIFLFSVTAAVFIDQSGTVGKFMEDKGIPFLMLWGFGTFFAETYWSGKKALKWCAAAGFGVIAAGLVHFSSEGSELLRENADHWIAAYSIILIVLGVYKNYKRSGLPFNLFCIRVVHELSRLAILCSIISIGIVLVMAVFVTLILNGEHYMLIIRAEFIILGCLFGSGLLDAQIRLDRELPRFFVVIVKYLLMSLLTAAFLIIYAYILKIIITRVVPSNEIFRILAALFIIGLPIWTMAGTFEEDHLLVRIGVILPYVFIPFLFLQGYAIRERITAYGMTPSRYLCLVLMAFEIIYIAVYALQKRETGIMLPVIAGFAFIALVLPYGNMFSTANRSQKAIFDRFISDDFSSLSSDDQSSLAGAYYYLAGNEEGKALLTEADPEKIETIKASGKIGDQDYDSNMFIFFEFPVKDADISGFDRMTMLSSFDLSEGKNPQDHYDPEHIEFFDGQGNVVLTADVSDFLNACISAYALDPLGTPDFPGEIRLDDGSLILVSHCSMTVEPGQNITFLDLNGFLLTRQDQE